MDRVERILFLDRKAKRALAVAEALFISEEADHYKIDIGIIML